MSPRFSAWMIGIAAFGLALFGLVAWLGGAQPVPDAFAQAGSRGLFQILPFNTSGNCSGTIASGGTAQAIALPLSPLPTPGPALHGIQIMNRSTDVLVFSELASTITTGTNGRGWLLSPQSSTAAGGSWTSPPNYAPSQTIYINGNTTGDAFECAYW